MRRLLKQSFTFEKNRYLLTLDTDNMRLFLNCYSGGSEKNDKVEIQDQGLRSKIFSIISEEKGSDLAANALRSPEKINPRVREYNQIPYPDVPVWDELILDILRVGQIEFVGEMEAFLEYLDYKEIKVVHFNYRNKAFIMDARCETNKVKEFVGNLENEIVVLKKLKEDVINQMDHIQSKTEKEYWRWKM